MRLSKRLEMVASMVEKGSRIADIGTDHAYLPIALVERGICPGAVAMDIGRGPLGRAREHVAACGLEGKIVLRLSDGLSALLPGEADTAVMAGMGGELVIHSLEMGRHLWGELKSLVLSPQSELDKVRHYLEDQGFWIVREEMAEEDGKFYTAMLVRREKVPYTAMPVRQGEKSYGRPVDYLYGKYLIETKNPVLALFLDRESARLKGILEGLKGQNTKKAAAARESLAVQLAWIREGQDEMQRDH